ncbi:MAG TPA: DUF1800 domain-containing protein [Planctomycetota bacterium]|nr:DUF1800 domain-containing protein [Planctomycetota bacterium]
MRRLLLLALLGPAVAAPAAPLDPLPASAWTPAAAAHLLRRAGFGGTPEEIRAFHALGLDGAVDRLLGFDGQGDVEVPGPGIALTTEPGRDMMMAAGSQEERQQVQRQYRQQDAMQLARVREWWIQTMIRTRWPLRERMVLFWHCLFTSGYRDVRNSYHMYVQNTLFRRHAAGSFRTLLHEVSKDPAMLEYLDNNRNRKEHPNENYAREVMELFTLGTGNYTEEDIKELARGLTGWTFEGNRFEFQERQHDGGEKTFLGRRGRFGGDDMLDIILAQPAASRHLAGRLWDFFGAGDPDPAVIDGLARTLAESDWQLAPALRRLFRSRAFFATAGARIKSPVELIVCLYKSTGLSSDGAFGLSFAGQALGQSLMDPPNVKGWPGGTEWITTSLLFARYNVASAIVGLPQDRARLLEGATGPAARGLRQMQRARRVDPNGEEMEGEGMGPGEGMEEEADAPPRRGRGRRGGEGLAPVYDVLGEVRERGLEKPGEIVDFYAGALLVVPPPPELRSTLVEYLDGLDLKRPDAREKLHGMLRLLVSTPEFQIY